MSEKTPSPNHGRRNFLKKTSFASMLGVWGSHEVTRIQPAPAIINTRPKQRDGLNIAVIGFGPWGREIADTIGRIEDANLAAICDNYPNMLRRARRNMPDVTTYGDVSEVLADDSIQAVCVATPTHMHKDIVIAALDAGKHVYCEAPMAHTIEDAAAIAKAAQAHEDNLVFQVGLPYRTDPQYRSVHNFIRSGATGNPVFARGQWNSKQSWRSVSSNRDREIAQNWRLDASVSTGLLGEVGIHLLDTAKWYLEVPPVSVTGFSSLAQWNDGREVPDTVQAIITFEDGSNYFINLTLASSFEARNEVYHGTSATIMLRDSRGWMFKEVDAPMLGWEVYARKDRFYKDKGIALVANATQLDAQAMKPWEDDPNAETPLWHGLSAFVENFVYGPYPAAAGYMQGYQANVLAIKANEAAVNNTKVDLDASLFELS